MNENKLIAKLNLWAILHGFNPQDLHSLDYSCSYCHLREINTCNTSNLEWQSHLIANIEHNKINKVKINRSKSDMDIGNWTCVEFIRNLKNNDK